MGSFVRRAHFGRIDEVKPIFSSAPTSSRSRTLARRTSTARPRSGSRVPAHGRDARRRRGHRAFSSSSTWRQSNRPRRPTPEPAFGGRLLGQGRSADRRLSKLRYQKELHHRQGTTTTPVILPPGRLRLATRPSSTRSLPVRSPRVGHVELFGNRSPLPLQLLLHGDLEAALHANHGPNEAIAGTPSPF